MHVYCHVQTAEFPKDGGRKRSGGWFFPIMPFKTKHTYLCIRCFKVFYFLASPLIQELICPDVVCELCPPGEVPEIDARGCWSSCICKTIKNPCSSYLCPANQRCELSWLTNKPSCVDNCPKHCPEIYRPVCGSDIKTYDNECELKVRSCLTGGKLKKIADQVCCFRHPITSQYTCIARK